MSLLIERQQDFARMIMSGDKSAMQTQLTETAISKNERLSIYANNVLFSLTEALADTFPVIKRLVGDEFFRFAARSFIQLHPPKEPVLATYGAEFDTFLNNFESASSLPYLSDVAQLEFAWLQSYHEHDRDPLTLKDLQSIPPDKYAELCFNLHPSRRFVHSDYPVARIWEVNQLEEPPKEVIDLSSGPEHVLVIRPRAEVEVRTLTPATYDFLNGLDSGATLTSALDSAFQQDENFKLQSALQQLIAGGTFTDFKVE